MHYFYLYTARLLFVTYTARGERDATSDRSVKPIEIARNYTNIWQKYPQYDETNTLMISNFYNLEEEFRRNDLVLPQFHPRLGQTDFLDDKHLAWTTGYINYLASLELTLGEDVRACMEHLPYENYLRKVTRSMSYDSYKSPTTDIHF